MYIIANITNSASMAWSGYIIYFACLLIFILFNLLVASQLLGVTFRAICST